MGKRTCLQGLKSSPLASMHPNTRRGELLNLALKQWKERGHTEVVNVLLFGEGEEGHG